jgi:ketosteroid isomerase-like protein
VATSSISELTRGLFAVYEAKDRRFVEDLLSDDFTFTSPLYDHIGRTIYFERCWPNSDKIRAFTIEKLFEQGAEVFVRYRAETSTGKQFRNTELFRFEGSKLAEVDVYFGRTIVEGSQKE